MQILETDLFQLEISAMNYGPDTGSNENAWLDFKVFSDDFSAVSGWLIDLSELALFTADMKNMAEDQEIEARLSAKGSSGDFVCFRNEPENRVMVNGSVSATGNSGFRQRLEFQNDLDADVFRKYAEALFEAYSRFIEEKAEK